MYSPETGRLSLFRWTLGAASARLTPGSLNDLAVGPHNLHILPGYLDGQMPYVSGAFHR